MFTNDLSHRFTAALSAFALVLVCTSLLAPTANAVRVNNLRNIPIAKTAIEKACVEGDLPMLETLLRDPNDVNRRNASGAKLIIFAVMSGDTGVVDYLIARGAVVNERDGATGLYPIHLAAFGDGDMVRCLLDHGADANAPAGAFGSALNMAVDRRDFDVAELLLKRKANTESKSCVTVCGDDGHALGRNKRTPLFVAASNGQINMVRLLVKYHADVNSVEELLPPVRDGHGYPAGPVMSSPGSKLSGGEMPLDAAIEYRHADVIRYLKSVGAKSKTCH